MALDVGAFGDFLVGQSVAFSSRVNKIGAVFPRSGSFTQPIEICHVIEALMLDGNAFAFVNNISKVIDGFLLTCRNDDAYTVMYISDGFENIFGHNIKSFMAHGADYAALIHPDDLSPVSIAVADALRMGIRWQIRYRLKTAQGLWRHVLETGGGRSNPRGHVEYLDCIIIDFAQMNELVGRLEAGEVAVEAIGSAVKRIVSMLETLRMLSFNARIEAAHTGAGPGFSEVAREMGDLATIGDDVAMDITYQLKRLRGVLRS